MIGRIMHGGAARGVMGTARERARFYRGMLVAPIVAAWMWHRWSLHCTSKVVAELGPPILTAAQDPIHSDGWRRTLRTLDRNENKSEPTVLPHLTLARAEILTDGDHTGAQDVAASFFAILREDDGDVQPVDVLIIRCGSPPDGSGTRGDDRIELSLARWLSASTAMSVLVINAWLQHNARCVCMFTCDGVKVWESMRVMVVPLYAAYLFCVCVCVCVCVSVCMWM